MISSICVLIMLIGATYTDIRYRKIFNIWLLFWLLIGVYLNRVNFIVLVCSSVLVLLIFHILRMIGAGDIKLIAIIIGYMGVGNGIKSVFTGLLLSAIYSLYLMYSKKILFSRLKYFSDYVMLSINSKTIFKYYDKKRDDIGVSIALAPWILLGFCIWRLCDIWLLKI
jgi:peptidase A24A, prepilin type IV